MQVVEHDDEWPVLREELEQLPRGAVRAVALVGDGSGRALARSPRRGDDLAELGHEIRAPVLVQVELLRGDVCVHRIGPHAERHLALELRRRASKDETALLLRPVAHLCEQVGLADPRLALDGDACRRRRIEGRERIVELLQLRLTSDRGSDAEFE